MQIAPTENDEKFRKQIIQGYVHDPGAALLGGVAGHAGLFGNALDVAKVMQLYLNKGELNGVRILDSNVVKEFTSCHFCPGNRRGLCFEKPEVDSKKITPWYLIVVWIVLVTAVLQVLLPGQILKIIWWLFFSATECIRMRMRINSQSLELGARCTKRFMTPSNNDRKSSV